MLRLKLNDLKDRKNLGCVCKEGEAQTFSHTLPSYQHWKLNFHLPGDSPA